MARQPKTVASTENIRTKLQRQLRAIARGEKAPDSKVKIIRHISGGAPGDRISRHVEILGDGSIHYEEMDETRDKETRKYSMTMEIASLSCSCWMLCIGTRTP